MQRNRCLMQKIDKPTFNANIPHRTQPTLQKPSQNKNSRFFDKHITNLIGLESINR